MNSDKLFEDSLFGVEFGGLFGDCGKPTPLVSGFPLRADKSTDFFGEEVDDLVGEVDEFWDSSLPLVELVLLFLGGIFKVLLVFF